MCLSALTVWQLICGNLITCNYVFGNMGNHSKASSTDMIRALRLVLGLHSFLILSRT